MVGALHRAGAAERRFLLTCALAENDHHPDFNRPELADDVQRISELFINEFGYRHVPLADSPRAEELLDRLREFCLSPDRQPQDYVVVYIAGHGETLGDGEHVLLARDTDPDDLYGKAIRTADLIRAAMAETRLRRLLLLLDTCYSGQGAADLSREALRRIDWPGPAHGDGVVIVAAARPWQEARPGVFSSGFVRAARSPAAAGDSVLAISIGAILSVLRDDPDIPESQSAVWHLVGATGAEPAFLPNPRYQRSHVDIDLLEQDRRRARALADVALAERFVPASRWFTGRHRALCELAGWLRDPARDPQPRVVTGNAGSGKTALLGLLAGLSDPERRPAIARDELPADAMPPVGGIDLAIYAGAQPTDDIRAVIAAAAGLAAGDVSELIDGLNNWSRVHGRPLLVLMDALDEAADPDELIVGLLQPLIRYAWSGVRLLLGTRPHLLTDQLLGRPDSRQHLLVDLDSDTYADPEGLRSYIRRILLAEEEDPLDSAYRPSGIYRAAPSTLLQDVAQALADAAGKSFLVARITATTEATTRSLPNPQDPGWRAGLPRRAGPAMARDLRLRLGEKAEMARELLLPLAYAQGNGLPFEDVWVRLANALSPGHAYTNADVVELRRTAGSYAVEGVADGRSVYRLYHQALVDYLREGRDEAADHGAITRALLALVPARPGGRDFDAGHPYIRTHLATHAARAGTLDLLLDDPGFLLAARPAQLLAALGAARTDSGRAAADAYRRAAHQLDRPRPEAAAYLQLAARCGRAPRLAVALTPLVAGSPWHSLWASWRNQPSHRTLHGHKGCVRAVAVGELAGRPVVVSGGKDSTVRVWDLATGEPTGRPFTGHDRSVSAVAVGELAGRPVVVSGGKDSTVRVWDLATGKPTGRPFTGHNGSVSAVAVGELAGRPVVVSGGKDSTVRVWDLATGEPTGRPFTGHDGSVSAVAVGELAGRPVVVSGGKDSTVRVWDLATGQLVGRPFTGHTGGVSAVAVGELAGGPVVVSGGDWTVRVWDLATGEPTGVPFTGHVWGVSTVAVGELAGRPVVVSGSNDRTVRVWDLSTGQLVGRPFTGHTGGVSAVAVGELAGGPVVVSGGEDSTVHVWDLATGEPTGVPFTGHRRGVSAVAVGELAGGPVVVSGGEDSTVRVWDLATGEPTGRPFTGHEGSVSAVAVGELAGRPVVVSGGKDSTVRVWDLATGEPTGRPFTGHNGSVSAVAVGELAGRPVVVSGGKDSTVRVWDLATGEPTGRPFTGHDGSVSAVAVGELAGRPVVVSGGDWTVRVWDLATGEPTGRPFTGHDGSVSAVAVGELAGRPVVVSGGKDSTVQVWDLATGEPTGRPFTGHEGWVSAVAVGELAGRPVVVSGSNDRTVRVWDLATGQLVGRPFTGHTGGVSAVAVGESAGGPVVVSGGDWTVRVWDLATGEPTGRPFTGHDGSVSAVAVGELAGRPVVVSGGKDSTVRVWDLATGKPTGRPFTGHEGWVSAVAVGELAGRPVVVSGSAYGTVRLWDLAAGELVGLPFTGHEGPVRAVAVGELAGRPVVVSSSRKILVWDVATSRRVSRPFTGYAAKATAVAVGELAGRPVVVTGRRHTVRVWEVPSGRPVGRRLRTTSAVSAVAVGDLDGDPVALCGSADGIVWAWDLATRRPLGGPFTGYSDRVTAVTVTDINGRSSVLSVGENGTVSVWNLDGVETFRLYLGGPLNALATRADTCVTAGEQGLVAVHLEPEAVVPTDHR